ncbi:MAG: hypothetical protein WCU88_05375 [Elusimicrobiota bacterium]|jgi:hypothetical protein
MESRKQPQLLGQNLPLLLALATILILNGTIHAGPMTENPSGAIRNAGVDIVSPANSFISQPQIPMFARSGMIDFLAGRIELPQLQELLKAPRQEVANPGEISTLAERLKPAQAERLISLVGAVSAAPFFSSLPNTDRNELVQRGQAVVDSAYAAAPLNKRAAIQARMVEMAAALGLSEREQAILAGPPVETLYFDSLAGRARQHFKKFSSANKVVHERDLSWEGPSLPRTLRAGSLEFTDHLKASNLQYSLEDQGRDNLEEILGMFIQVGIGQGYRRFMNGTNILRAHASLAQALSLAESGDLMGAAVLSDKAAGIAALIAKGVNPSLGKSAPLEATSRAKMDWPQNGLPAHDDQIIARMAALLHEAYEIDLTSRLKTVLMKILSVGIDQGQRIAAKDFSGSPKSLIEIAQMQSPARYTDPELIKLTRDGFIQSLKSALHELKAAQLDQYSFHVPKTP